MKIFRGMFDSAFKIVSFNVIVAVIIVTILTFTNHIIMINDFVKDHKTAATKIRNIFVEGKCTNVDIVTDNHIYVKTKDKEFELTNRKFIETAPHKHTFSEINLNNNVYFAFPEHVIFKFTNTDVVFDASHVSSFSILMYVALILLTTVINVMFIMIVKTNLVRMKSLKISAQEYALSERTTSYLVNIMHHKLNTPLKVLSTKTRVLIETITKNNNVEENIKEKAEWDYVQVDRALKTIFNVTSKLKSYNELSQNEINMYKLFTISKETIDIMKDDEFEIDIDYKAKLFEIDKRIITSHETIQIFINQIKFSLSQLADKISIKVFNHDESAITVLYSDNGNIIDDELLDLIQNNIPITDLDESQLETDHFDLILNFNIINANNQSQIRLLKTNDNGNVFEIKLPTFKKKVEKNK